MLYLSGAIRRELKHPMLGWMVTPEMGNEPNAGDWWAADNGCFAHPERFDMERYAAYLDKRLAVHGETCLFVTAPDVPFDADGTLQRFERYGERVKATGARVALVTQDGMHAEDIPWRDLDALFVGGSTEWKTGQESSALITTARERGLWVHMGRVNSYRRLKTAASMGCDSVDGTYLKYGPDVNWPKLKGWLDRHKNSPVMRLA